MFDSGHRATPATRGAEAAASYEREHGRDTPHGPAGAGPPGRRPRHVFEVEDLLLAGWIFAASVGTALLIGRLVMGSDWPARVPASAADVVASCR